MGFTSHYADCIEWEEIKKLCPQEAGDFLATLGRYGVRLERFAQAFMCEEIDTAYLISDCIDTPENEDSDEFWDRLVADLTAAYERLQAAFAKATTVGQSHLDLKVGYHNKKEGGDCYDEVDGVFWDIDGAYDLAAAGKKFQDLFERRFFVNWA
jgi:hypothetical protein